MLAGFFLVIDVVGLRGWSMPLVVVGTNSLAMYVMAQIMKPWVAGRLKAHLGPDAFGGVYGSHRLFPAGYAHVAESTVVLFVLWLICYYMYRNKIFIRI
jgi:predicted acyltransferase